MKRIVFAMLGIVFFAECNFNDVTVDNLSVERYSGLIGVPVGEAIYTFEELLLGEFDSSDLEVGADSIYVFVYRDSISFDNTTDFIDIENISNTAIISGTSQAAVSVATAVPLNSTFTFNYQPTNNEELDSIVYESGELLLQMNSSFGSPISYDLTVINTVDLATNQSVVFNGTIGANSSIEDSRSLANHSTSFERDGDLNTFLVQFDGTVLLEAGQRISSTDVLSFTLTFRDQEFEIIFGFFGQDNIQVGNQFIDLSFFEDLGAGVTFERPEITMVFSNSYGMPIGLLFSSIFGLSGDSDSTFLTGTVTQTPQRIAYPTEDQIGQTLDSTLIINQNNSNLREVLAQSPRELGFNLRALINPDGDTGERNFVQNTNRLDADITMRLPLSVRIENVTRSLDFEVGELDLSDADSINMRLVTENQMPADATMTVSILDADSVSLYEIPENLVIAPPFINRSGEVVQGEVNIANIPLDSAGVAAFAEGQFLSFTLNINTPETLNSQEIFVDFLAQYTLEIKVSLVVKTDLDL